MEWNAGKYGVVLTRVSVSSSCSTYHYDIHIQHCHHDHIKLPWFFTVARWSKNATNNCSVEIALSMPAVEFARVGVLVMWGCSMKLFSYRRGEGGG